MPFLPADLVDLRPYLPTAIFDVRYATTRNFTGRRLYPVARVFLSRAAAERLRLVHDDLLRRGLRLRIYDGYRPLSATRVMWNLIRDERYVADPKKGSRHNRGCAVDLDLLDRNGRPLEMPTAFDDFSPRAWRSSLDCTVEAAQNRQILEDAMRARGFSGLATEWWHFDLDGWRAFPVRDTPLTDLARRGDRRPR